MLGAAFWAMGGYGAALTHTPAADSTGSSDTRRATVGAARTDPTGLADTTSRSVHATATDSTGSRDSTGRAVGTVRGSSAALTDTAERGLTRPASSSTGLTDSLGPRSLHVTVTSSSPLADPHSLTAGYAAGFDSPLAASDTHRVDLRVVFASSVGLDDSSVIFQRPNLTVASSAAASDTSSVLVGRGITDTAGGSDSTARAATYNRTFTEAGQLLPTLNGQIGQPGLLAPGTVAGAAAGDSLVLAVAIRPTDSVGSGDQLDRTATYQRDVSDPSASARMPRLGGQPGQPGLLEPGGFPAAGVPSDTTALAAGYSRGHTDPAGLADSSGLHLRFTVGDPLVVSDTLGPAGYGRAVTDPTGLVDTTSRDLTLTITDRTGLTDAHDVVAVLFIEHDDTAHLDDTAVDLAEHIGLTYSDTAGLTDTSAAGIVRPGHVRSRHFTGRSRPRSHTQRIPSTVRGGKVG